MSVSFDKQTYAGQYASRKLHIKKMDSNNKQRLRVLIAQLGILLNTRKALNSKVTSRHFELFRDAAESGADAYDIKSRLNRLEQMLKHEGLFKNVKSDFVNSKKDILGCLYWTENPATAKQTLPGISVAKDKTFYINPKQSENEQPAPSMSTGRTKHHAMSMSTDDMRILNSAIGKLFRHLQINAKDQTEAAKAMDVQNKEELQLVDNKTLASIHVQPEDTFHDLVMKLRNFEKEFQRQKVQQQRELMRLQEEIKRINKNSNELRKENERIKGVQPILTKAKGKQVERIEEKYRSEKKGMEEKIHELESGMKRNLQQYLSGKEGARAQLKEDVESIVFSINNIHHMVLGRYHDIHLNSRDPDDAEILPTKDILNMLTSVAGGVQVMKTKSVDLNSKTEELAVWKKSLKDLDREIERFSRTFSDSPVDKEETTLHHEQDPTNITYHCKAKLQKTKENINTKLKKATDSASIIQRKEKDVSKYKRNLEELQSEISKLHDQVLAVQIQDISISRPTFERRQDPGDRSDGSADELPEADREEQNDLLDKLKQIGTMVNHFQQLIKDRTETLNKMENDMLPLKIRVNRLHESISKAMNTSDSPDHDPADDIVKPKRAFSPEGGHSSGMISKEVSNMLGKLSKMELTIRQLLEAHAASSGRASI